jgi:hypothetical protein
MKISKDKLNEYIKLYLNDADDYGNGKESIIAEEVLKLLNNNILTEDEFDLMETISELSKKPGSKYHKIVLEDFAMYVENI